MRLDSHDRFGNARRGFDCCARSCMASRCGRVWVKGHGDPTTTLPLRHRKVTIDDGGEEGTTSEGNDTLSTFGIALAVHVAPVNDIPRVIVPREFMDKGPLTAQEDRVGVIGTDCCGWSSENIIEATIISNASVELADADLPPHGQSLGEVGERLRGTKSRWVVAPAYAEDHGAGSLQAPPLNETVTLEISVRYGGVLLSDVHPQASINNGPEGFEIRDSSTDLETWYASSVKMSGPLFAVARSVRGMRYRTRRNWNSWVGSGKAGLEPVKFEVSPEVGGLV